MAAKPTDQALAAGFRIGHLADLLRTTDADLRMAVEEARRLGLSWPHIGIMLGCSKQSAWQKYGRKHAG